MADLEERLQVNTYIWSQSNDQVTISFLVPETCKAKDVDIVIEHQHVKAGLKGQEPVLKGRLFGPVNHFESLWQLEKTAMSPFSSLATSPSFSIASSYAFMSSPNHSPNSSMILPAPALAEASTHEPSSSEAQLAEIYQQTAALGNMSVQSSSLSDADESLSRPTSPAMMSTPPVAATPNMHGDTAPAPKYRILTIHLEKEREGVDWAVPVSGGWKSETDIDVTSAYHLAGWFETRIFDYGKAFKIYLDAAERGHVPSMIKVAAIYEMDYQPMNEKATPPPDKDPKKAFLWYKRAADAVSDVPGVNSITGPDALACYIVGSTFGSGSEPAGVDKNYELALLYFNRAMTITAPYIDIDFSLLNGDKVPKSLLRHHAPHTRDERYFCSAAFQTGLIYLYGSQAEGEMLHSSTLVEVDPAKAIRYWKEAAVLGHAQAAYNIGIMYANGMGVEQDLWEAGKWFYRAVKLDTTGKLVVPDGVQPVADWDAKPKDEKAEQAEKEPLKASESRKRSDRQRKKRRSKRQQAQGNDGLLGAAIVVGSIVAVAGVAWWWYNRIDKERA